MSASHFLIVNFHFNYPVVRIIGPIRDQTIEKLNSVLASKTTSLRSTRAGNPKFEYIQNPAHWVAKLEGQYCDEVGKSALFLALFDALEEEGGWKMASTNAVTMKNEDALQQEVFDEFKFFFVRIQ